MTLSAGQSVTHQFSVNDDAMRLFQALSQDMSRIHCDADFARSRGYRDVIVYGGIILAQLSHVLGTSLPGPSGTSTQWRIDYRRPLYKNELATLTLAVSAISPSTGLVECKFRVEASEGLVASGTAQSIVPLDELE